MEYLGNLAGCRLPKDTALRYSGKTNDRMGRNLSHTMQLSVQKVFRPAAAAISSSVYHVLADDVSGASSVDGVQILTITVVRGALLIMQTTAIISLCSCTVYAV